MDGDIQPLPVEVKSLLRTGVALTSVTQCVEELLLNAIDAGATCIAVRVDLSLYKVQVLDNGCGMSASQLKSVGGRYHTSKCHEVRDLNNLCYYGYRGEALASLKDICSILEIVSRDKLSSISYCKMFQKGRSLPVIESTVPRPSKGTTVTAHDLFYNLPVRRKSTNESLEFERVRQRLEAIALVQPDISISLRNDVTGNVVLQTQKVNSILKTFTTLFGKGKASNMKRVENESAQFKVEAYINTDTSSRKDHQFVYVNKRQVLKTEIHKSMNYLLGRSVLLKTKSISCINNVSKSESPTKPSDRYGIFVLCLTCPYDEYDITFEPAKTLIQFKHWMDLRNCIEEMVMGFLRQENLLSVGQMLELNQKYYSQSNNLEEKRTYFEEKDVGDTQENHDVEITESLEGRSSNERNSGKSTFNISSTTIKNSLSSKCVSRVTKSANKKDKVNGNSSEDGENSQGQVELCVTKNGCSGISAGDSENSTGKLPDENSINVKRKVVEDPGNSFCTPQKCVMKQRDAPPSPKHRRRSLDTPLLDTGTPESDCESESPLSVKCSSCSKQNSDSGLITMPTPLVGPSGISSLSLFKKRYQTRESLKNRFANTRILNVEAEKCVGFKTSSHAEVTVPDTALKPAGEMLCHTVHKKSMGDFRKRILLEASNMKTKHLRLEKPKAEGGDKGFSGTCDNICHADINLGETEAKDIMSSASCDFICHEDMRLDETEARKDKSFETCDPICHEEMSLDEPRQENKVCSATSDLRCHEDIRLDESGVDNSMSSASCDLLCHEDIRGVDNKVSSASCDLLCHEDIRGVDNNMSSTSCDLLCHEDIRRVDNNMSSASCDLLCHEDFHSSVAAAESTDTQSFYVKESLSTQGNDHVTQETQKFFVSSQGFLVSETFRRDESSMNTHSPDLKESSGESNCPFSRFEDRGCNSPNGSEGFSPTMDDIDTNQSLCDDTFDQMEGQKCIGPCNAEQLSGELPQNSNCRQERIAEDTGHSSPIMMSISRFVREESDMPICLTSDITSGKIVSPNQEISKQMPKNTLREIVDRNANDAKCSPDYSAAMKKSQTSDCSNTNAKEEDISIKGDCKCSVEDSNKGSKDGMDDLCSQWSDISDEQMLNALSITTDKPSQNGGTGEPRTKVTHSSDLVDSAKQNNSSLDQIKILSTSHQNHCFIETNQNGKSINHIPDKCESEIKSIENLLENDDQISGTLDGHPKSKEVNTSAEDMNHSQDSSSRKAEKLQLWVKMTTEKSGAEIYVNTMTGHTMKNPDFLPPQIDQTKDDLEPVEEDRSKEKDRNCQIKPLSPASHNALLSMIEDGFDDDEDVKTVKWKDGKSESTQLGKKVEDLLEMWDNPVFHQPEKEVMSAEVSKDKGMSILKAHHLCNPLKFTKDMLQSYKVLGQVDNKFIACLLNDEKSKASAAPSLIVLFDQHAVHERIRLEDLTANLFKEAENCEDRQVKSTYLNPAKVMLLPEACVQVMSSFRKEIYKIGVSFHLYKKERDKIVINEIPECIAKVEPSERKRNNSTIVWDLVEALLKEYVEMLKSTKGAASSIPQTIHRMLCSQACHGAIKFGDALTLEECENLLSSLAMCKLPFQCAHGRPSVMPILQADKLFNRNERRPPNLWKLHNNMQQNTETT